LTISDKPEVELARKIHATLLPEGSEFVNGAGESFDTLPVSAIQTSLRAIAKRVNYGIESSQDEDVVPPVRING